LSSLVSSSSWLVVDETNRLVKGPNKIPNVSTAPLIKRRR
jgi:hypothetical protein